MLQNASYLFFKKKQNDYEKKKKVSPSRSRTRNLQHVRATHYPLRHAAIAKTVCQINIVFNIFVPARYSRRRRKYRRMTK